MNRWVGKVAIVTGASSGIGAAIVIELLKSDVIVVGLARRVELVQNLSSQVDAKQAQNLHALQCDVSKETDLLAAFAWVDTHLGGADILVNNAGIARMMNLIDADNTKSLKEILDTNLLAVIFCTREFFQSMKRRSVNNGHVVMMNSIHGHILPFLDPTDSRNLYSVTKHALTAMVEILRKEFIGQGTKHKITVRLFKSKQRVNYICYNFKTLKSVSPGYTRTDMIPVELIGDNSLLEPADVAAAVLYTLGTPPHVQVYYKHRFLC